MKSIHHLPLMKFGSLSSARPGSSRFFIDAARPLRHDAFEAQFARLGEHDSALGDERFAEQDSAGASDEPLECLPTLFDRRFIRSDDARLR
jgi:hypothetical protein